MGGAFRKPLAASAGHENEPSRRLYRIYEEQCIADPARPVSRGQYGDAAIGYAVAGSCDYRAQTGAIVVVPGTVVFGNGEGQNAGDARRHQRQ